MSGGSSTSECEGPAFGLGWVGGGLTSGCSDDKVEENYLADAFETTCRIWQVRPPSVCPPSHSPPRPSAAHTHARPRTPQDRYKVPYTYCGCPLPGSSIGARLARLTRRVLPLRAPGAHLAPPAGGNARAATHGSDHNAVCASWNPALSRRKALELARRRRAREERWGSARVEAGRAGGGGGEHGEAEVHEIAFLVPVPFVPQGKDDADAEGRGRCVPVNQRQCVAGVRPVSPIVASHPLMKDAFFR